MGKWATGTTRKRRQNLVPTSTSTSSTTLKEVVRLVRDADLVALDLESTGLDPRRAEIRLIQITTGEETFVIDCLKREEADLRILVEALAGTPVVAHGRPSSGPS